jgi:TrmH family RNA methyltransferase
MRTPRVIAARRLHRRRDRDETGLFLAEGPQAVREATGVVELFGTPEALERYAGIVAAHPDARVSAVTGEALAALADTVTPQGLVAVCRHLHVTEVPPAPRLAVLLAGIADPGNAGTVLRTADAAGASTVIFPDGTVDPYNGKCVRATAGSLFHVTVVRGGPVSRAVEASRAAGLQVLAADGYGEIDLDTLIDTGRLARRTTWIFGSEAHGLDAGVAAAADARVRIPIHGRAESLNLAAAAAVCLYASARALRTSEESPC